jgi:hypothetical protein
LLLVTQSFLNVQILLPAGMIFLKALHVGAIHAGMGRAMAGPVHGLRFYHNFVLVVV